MKSPLRMVFACIAALALSAVVAGCDEDDPRRDDAKSNANSARGEHREKWLQPNSRLTPAQWLASRNLAEPRSVDDPEVKRIDALLTAANQLYRESERMIANRTVQLEDMLRDIGVAEKASEILDDLMRVAGEVGQTEGFGAVSQHYFNLRSNKASRDEALALLKSRYGRRQ